MDSALTHFQTDNLEIKLTEEKLFITTPTSTETFALRSIDGIGVIDLVNEYNNVLTTWKSGRTVQVIFLFFGVIICLIGLYTLTFSTITGAIVFLFGFLFTLPFILGMKNKAPKLLSAVRIMMSSGNRDFHFDKASLNSMQIAEFVANVEDTLTAFHKK